MAFRAKRAFSDILANESSRGVTKLEEEPWSVEAHRAFVEAIVRQGIAHASPAVIQKEMILNTEAITTERIKSKLQKYRKSKEKSISEFMREYDQFTSDTVNQIKNVECKTSLYRPDFYATEHEDICGLLSGGAAAFLTQKVMAEECSGTQAHSDSELGQMGSHTGSKYVEINSIEEFFEGTEEILGIPLPQLSKEETESSVGKAMLHVVGILKALNEQRMNDMVSKSDKGYGDEEVISPHQVCQKNVSEMKSINVDREKRDIRDSVFQNQSGTMMSPLVSFESAELAPGAIRTVPIVGHSEAALVTDFDDFEWP